MDEDVWSGPGVVLEALMIGPFVRLFAGFPVVMISRVIAMPLEELRIIAPTSGADFQTLSLNAVFTGFVSYVAAHVARDVGATKERLNHEAMQRGENPYPW